MIFIVNFDSAVTFMYSVNLPTKEKLKVPQAFSKALFGVTFKSKPLVLSKLIREETSYGYYKLLELTAIKKSIEPHLLIPVYP